MARTLIHVTPARRGEAFQVRATIAHPMETGYRTDDQGRLLPRDILLRFSAHYAGAPVFSADLFPAIAANPSLSFFVRAVETGPLTLNWVGDHGFTQTETVLVSVAE
jgi:sulfur-oxidizing protein SoxZ